MKDFLYIGKIFNLCRMSKDGNSTGFVDDPGSLEGTHLDLTEISWFSCRDERIKNVLYGWKIPLFDENAGNMGTPKAMGACCFPLYFLKGKLISQGLDFSMIFMTRSTLPLRFQARACWKIGTAGSKWNPRTWTSFPL